MKATEYHLYDVVFVIEATASCGVYMNEMKTNYVIPALEFFSQGMEDIYSPSNKAAGSLFGIVSFKTSQSIPASNTYGPYLSPQKFLKTIDNLDLTGGKSESNANMNEGLATALVCFQDMEKIRDKDCTTNKHCILISNSSPYAMPVSECYEFEGKSTEQLAALFLENNINLSVISPRKIPVLYEIFEKSGGELAATTSKNYSKDPRHLVLLKGFSLKERPASPNMNQPATPQMPTSQQQPVQQNSQPPPLQQMTNTDQQQQSLSGNLGLSGNAPGIRPQGAAMRPNTPQMMQGGNAQQQPMNQMGNPQGNFAGNNPQGNFTQRPANPQQQNQNPRWNAPNQNRQPFMPNQGLPNQGGMQPGNIQGGMQGSMQAGGQMQGGGQMQAGGQMMSGNMPQNTMIPQNQAQQNPNQAQPNSALISQLTQPPNLTMTPQQQAMARMAAMQNQQQNQQMMQNQQGGMNPGQNPMQQQQSVQGGVPGNMQGMVPQQNVQQPGLQQQGGQMNPQQQQQQQQQQQIGMPGHMQRDRIWRGTLEWTDKQNQQNTTRQVQCEIYASISRETNEVEVRGDNWPNRLIMQLMPRAVITSVGGHLLREAKIVNFQWGQPSEAFEALSKVMANGFAGCVHFTPSQCDVKILILLYMPEKKSYYGFIPNDQTGYVDRLRRVIQQSKITTPYGQTPGPQNPQQQNPQQQQQVQQQQAGPRPQIMGMNPIAQQNTMNPQGGPQNMPNMQGQGDQNMMFNQQMQMQGGNQNMVGNQPMNPNQQRMARPNLIQNNLRHLLQQQQNQFRPQMGVPQQNQQQQQQPNQQMHGGMDPNYDMF